MSRVYINAVGRFLPGAPIGNDEVADYLGPLTRGQEKIRRIALRQNGIRRRHFALDRDGRALISNAGMAANACRAAIAASEIEPRQIGYLAAAASQGDLLAPGIASAVHGELALPPLEIASFNSFCASSMMALSAAHSAIAAGRHDAALVTGSEFASRFLRRGYLADAPVSTATEFLRWGLSDGAGAAVLERRPNERALSLEIEFIDFLSYADSLPTCMHGGARRRDDGTLGQPWSQYPTLIDAVRDGAFHLGQDFELLENITALGLNRYFELIEDRRIPATGADWLLCHFSSDVFRQKLLTAAKRAGAPLDPETVFTNIFETGNTGSAALFLLLHGLQGSGRLRPGQRILCMVPESGRFIISFLGLKVVGKEIPAATAAGCAAAAGDPATPTALATSTGRNPTSASLLRRLNSTWTEFEAALNTVPIIDKMQRQRLRLADYRTILLNMRQQVVDGSRWIARAASAMTDGHGELRSLFVRHAVEEHRDYEMLERDYVAVGGDLATIRSQAKNIGSEALSAWMFHRASHENPLDLLGAMFIIEGIGRRLAGRWADSIRSQLGLGDGQVSFLRYHADNDEGHLEKLWQLLDGDWLTPEWADAIVRTARVTARLYRLQLEEIGAR